MSVRESVCIYTARIHAEIQKGYRELAVLRRSYAVPQVPRGPAGSNAQNSKRTLSRKRKGLGTVPVQKSKERRHSTGTGPAPVAAPGTGDWSLYVPIPGQVIGRALHSLYAIQRIQYAILYTLPLLSASAIASPKVKLRWASAGVNMGVKYLRTYARCELMIPGGP